jgi:hypothetical protein
MTWWIWALAGLALLILEIATPGGFILLFFGAAALVVATLVATDAAGPLWLQLLTFSALSVVSLLAFRGPILRRMKAGPGLPDPVDTLRGETVVLIEDVAPQAEGRAEFRGTSWTVRNVDDRRLARGETVRVENVEGLKLFVRSC